MSLANVESCTRGNRLHSGTPDAAAAGPGPAERPADEAAGPAAGELALDAINSTLDKMSEFSVGVDVMA